MLSRRRITTLAVATVAAVALTALWGAVGAQEQEARPAPIPYKIGIIDQDAALEQFAQFQTEWKGIQAEKEAFQKEIDDRMAGLKKLQDDYLQRRDALSLEEQSKAENELNRQMRMFQADAESRRNEIESRGVRCMKKASESMAAAVRSIAEAGNYHLILRGDTPTAVVYYAPAIDITSQVVARLNGGK